MGEVDDWKLGEKGEISIGPFFLRASGKFNIFFFCAGRIPATGPKELGAGLRFADAETNHDRRNAVRSRGGGRSRQL